jgi:hypothetical protein
MVELDLKRLERLVIAEEPIVFVGMLFRSFDDQPVFSGDRTSGTSFTGMVWSSPTM